MGPQENTPTRRLSKFVFLAGCHLRTICWTKIQLDVLLQAAKIANAHEFISNFVDGYDTQVGERGIRLSGGQKQRCEQTVCCRPGFLQVVVLTHAGLRLLGQCSRIPKYWLLMKQRLRSIQRVNFEVIFNPIC